MRAHWFATLLWALWALAAHDLHADAPTNTVLATTPRDQAMKLYAQATKMFEDQDFVAAAVTFGQAQALLARVDRDASGAVIDKEAHAFRNAAVSNKATAYSRANLYVEAYGAFVELRDQFGAELSPADRTEVNEAIASTDARIGTLILRGLPAGELEVRIDGRLERRDVRQPLRLDEGDHALEIVAKGNKPHVTELTIVGGQQAEQRIALEPLKTPARVRIESTVGASRVVVDGRAFDAPAELDLAPGRHHVVVASESFVPQASDLDVEPGQRAVLRVTLARARAPLGLRISPSYVASFPFRTDTPFGAYNGSVGLALFHDAVRARNLRFGVAFEYTARKLDAVAIGAIATWCPDRFVWGQLAWCPATAVASYVFGDRDGVFETGVARGRAASSVELRRDHGFARLSVGIQLEDYARDFTNTDGSVATTFLFLGSSIVEAAVGLDL